MLLFRTCRPQFVNHCSVCSKRVYTELIGINLIWIGSDTGSFLFQDYAITLAKQMKPLQQVKKKKVGEYLDPQLLDHMTDEQIVQLYELHKAATELNDEDIHMSEDKK